MALDLRHSSYFADTPFLIPVPAPVCDLQEDVEETQTPQSPVATAAVSGVHVSPQPSARLASSPIKPISRALAPTAHPQSPLRLRHPSRLRTHDLTANTFKIYLKHYMDNYHTGDASRLDFDLSQIPSTPTKRHRVSEVFTPKLSSNYDAMTPRAKEKQPAAQSSEAGIQGFTLSYLRRVPELQDMARKVIEADDKTKRRAERKAREEAKLKGGQSSRKTQPKSNASKLSRHDRIKRLFRQAILKLCDDGDIVIWDGPKRVWQQDWGGDASRLWRMDATADITASSWAETTGSVSCDQDEEDELSEPLPDEESYVCLTPSHLGKYVEVAIRDILHRPKTLGREAPKGPTKAEILALLRADGRWRRVGDWAVEEALTWLKEEERVWDVGEGRWELTL